MPTSYKKPDEDDEEEGKGLAERVKIIINNREDEENYVRVRCQEEVENKLVREKKKRLEKKKKKGKNKEGNKAVESRK
jgi:hypothetical protein